MQDTHTNTTHGHRKKVCIAITKGHWGGAQQYVYTLATHLHPHHEVTVVSGPGLLVEKLREAGVSVTEISSLQRDIHLLSEIQGLWKLYTFLKKEKPDVLHLNSSKMGVLGTIAGRCAHIPRIIFTAHGWAFNEDRPYAVRLLFKLLQYSTILLSHKTIAVSAKAKQDIVSLPYTREKIVVIYNGIRDTYPMHSKTDSRRALGLPETAYLIGSVSELHKNKGIDIALEAMTRLPTEVMYAVVGDGEEKEHLLSLREKLGLQDRVFFVGRKENAKSYMHAFDLFLLPSRTEAFPYVLLEAGVAKLPVVASRVGGVPEVTENYKTGLLYKRGFVPEMVEVIRTAIQNPEKTKVLAAALHAEVTSRFTEEKMLSETVRLYFMK